MKQSDGLKRLAKPHIIRQNGAEPDPHIPVEPGISPLLVRAQLSLNPIRDRNFLFFGKPVNQFLRLIGKDNRSGIIFTENRGLKHLARTDIADSGDSLVDFLQILRRGVDVLSFEFQQFARLSEKPVKILSRDHLVAQGHLPLELEQIRKPEAGR